MVFRYTPILHQGWRRYVPLLSVQVGGAIDVFALVDSGSDHNIFSSDVAKALAIPLQEGEKVWFGGYGGGRLAGTLITTALALELDGRRITWQAPIIFSEAAKDRAVLGQEGFFAFFDIEFRRRQKEFSIHETQ